MGESLPVHLEIHRSSTIGQLANAGLRLARHERAAPDLFIMETILVALGTYPETS